MDLVKSKKEQMKMETMKMYSCPMHPDVTSDKPGQCSKCGMDMKEKENSKVVYSCPMKCEGEKTYDKPGKCPTCGMNLKEKKEAMNMGAMKMYACPMHAEVTSDKPGKCTKCGMELKEKEQPATVFACPMKCEGDKTYDKAGKCPTCGMSLKEKKAKQ